MKLSKLKTTQVYNTVKRGAFVLANELSNSPNNNNDSIKLRKKNYYKMLDLIKSSTIESYDKDSKRATLINKPFLANMEDLEKIIKSDKVPPKILKNFK